MTRDILLQTRVDAYDAFRDLPRRRGGGGSAVRTVFLTFDWKDDSSYFDVRAHGSMFPCGDNGEFMGRLMRAPEEVAAAVGSMLECWQQQVIKRKVPDTRASYWYEGLPVDDFGEGAAREAMEPVGLRLAREGHKLFQFLFGGADDGLGRIAAVFEQALRQGSQTVTVRSDDLFVPWGMLYLPPTPETPLYGKDASWEPAGFLGYGHLIEQTLKYASGYHPEIRYASANLRSAAHFDLKIQNASDDPPPLDTVRSVLEKHSDHTIVRTTKEDVAEAVCDPDTKEHILLFGSHGHAGRLDPRGGVEARVVLTDDDPILAGDLEYWGSQRKERLPNPLCFMMVCEGGRVTPMLHQGMGKALFGLGVGCLVGPQIDIPKKFASIYACRFLEAFFSPGARPASVARSLTREYFDNQATPLGLVFTLMRGVDNHLVPEAAPGEDAT